MKHGKNNKLKQTKHKRQLKNNKCSKTKYKRQKGRKGQIQYGGKKYESGTYPGLEEIKSVIKNNYETKDVTEELQKIYNHLSNINNINYKIGDVIPESLPEQHLIKLKNKMFSFGTIECDDETYLQLASLNLEKIIRYVLHWNPFLNYPQNYEKYVPHEVYGHVAKARAEDMRGADKEPLYLREFFDNRWWNSQNWWAKVVQLQG